MTSLADLPLLASGKVRELYDLSDRLLMVASDRISTYDAVHPTPIPDKGKVLTGLSDFWFEQTKGIVANHLISATEGVPRGGPRPGAGRAQAEDAAGRVRRARLHHRLRLEGLSGDRGRLGDRVAEGLRESEQLPEPIFTPSTKAEVGHDEAIDFERAAELVGDRGLMERVRDISIDLYSFAAAHARERGVILADTKFELGLDEDGELVVGDEVLTPDSSRYWPVEGYEVGQGAAELRQAVRARLGGRQRLGQEAARARDPRGRRRGDPRALRRGVRADHRRAILGVAGADKCLRRATAMRLSA